MPGSPLPPPSEARLPDGGSVWLRGDVVCHAILSLHRLGGGGNWTLPPLFTFLRYLHKEVADSLDMSVSDEVSDSPTQISRLRLTRELWLQRAPEYRQGHSLTVSEGRSGGANTSNSSNTSLQPSCTARGGAVSFTEPEAMIYWTIFSTLLEPFDSLAGPRRAMSAPASSSTAASNTEDADVMSGKCARSVPSSPSRPPSSDEAVDSYLCPSTTAPLARGMKASVHKDLSMASIDFNLFAILLLLQAFHPQRVKVSTLKAEIDWPSSPQNPGGAKSGEGHSQSSCNAARVSPTGSGGGARITGEPTQLIEFIRSSTTAFLAAACGIFDYGGTGSIENPPAVDAASLRKLQCIIGGGPSLRIGAPDLFEFLIDTSCAAGTSLKWSSVEGLIASNLEWNVILHPDKALQLTPHARVGSPQQPLPPGGAFEQKSADSVERDGSIEQHEVLKSEGGAVLLGGIHHQTVWRYQGDLGWPMKSVWISGCSDSTIYIMARVRHVGIYNCHDCRIVVAAASGVVSIHSSARITLHAVAGATRCENVTDSRLSICSRLRPVLTGDTRGIDLGPPCHLHASRLALLENFDWYSSNECATNFAYPLCATPSSTSSMAFSSGDLRRLLRSNSLGDSHASQGGDTGHTPLRERRGSQESSGGTSPFRPASPLASKGSMPLLTQHAQENETTEGLTWHLVRPADFLPYFVPEFPPSSEETALHRLAASRSAATPLPDRRCSGASLTSPSMDSATSLAAYLTSPVQQLSLPEVYHEHFLRRLEEYSSLQQTASPDQLSLSERKVLSSFLQASFREYLQKTGRAKELYDVLCEGKRVSKARTS